MFNLFKQINNIFKSFNLYKNFWNDYNYGGTYGEFSPKLPENEFSEPVFDIKDKNLQNLFNYPSDFNFGNNEKEDNPNKTRFAPCFEKNHGSIKSDFDFSDFKNIRSKDDVISSLPEEKFDFQNNEYYPKYNDFSPADLNKKIFENKKEDNIEEIFLNSNQKEEAKGNDIFLSKKILKKNFKSNIVYSNKINFQNNGHTDSYGKKLSESLLKAIINRTYSSGY